MKKYIGLTLLSLLWAGCASQTAIVQPALKKSIYHTGIKMTNQRRTFGIISAQDGRRMDAFIKEFHQLLVREEFDQAYDYFSESLKNEVTLIELIEYINHFKEQYGPEQDFNLTQFYKSRRFPDTGAALDQDAFVTYTAVMSYYLSRRQEDVIYSFGVVQDQEQLKIGLIGFHVPENDETYVHDAIQP